MFRYLRNGNGSRHTLHDLPSTADDPILRMNDAFLPVSQEDVTVLVNERRNVFRKSKETLVTKVPKELASISEQTQIPIYMDNLPRPPRKCRLITL